MSEQVSTAQVPQQRHASPAPPPLLEVQSLVKHFPLRSLGPLTGRLSPRRALLTRRAEQGEVDEGAVDAGEQARVVRAVDGVSFTLNAGQTLGLVGESGSGKSTLASLVMALQRPSAGSVRLQGQDLFSLSRRQLRRVRREVQMVWQDPYASLNPRMSVGQIVGEPLAIHPDVVPRAGRSAYVRDLLARVGLNPDFADRYPHQFSGGQRQRIGIARALALRPQVVICDEPVSALDVSVRAQVLNVLQDLQQEFGLAYLLISHDLSVVHHSCDEVAVMYRGQIVEHGTRDQVYSHPEHPYTQALLAAVPVPDPTQRTRPAAKPLPFTPLPAQPSDG